MSLVRGSRTIASGLSRRPDSADCNRARCTIVTKAKNIGAYVQDEVQLEDNLNITYGQPISLNPSRLGFVRVLQRMGAEIEIEVTHEQVEPVGRLKLRHLDLRGPLKGVRVEAAEVPSLIDELPLLAVLATQSEGITEVFGAQELRVKETDRIEAIASNLRLMGGKIETRPDGFTIQGPQKLRGAAIQSFHDHRIAMAFSIAALIAEGDSLIENADCVAVSYPDFFSILKSLIS